VSATTYSLVPGTIWAIVSQLLWGHSVKSPLTYLSGTAAIGRWAMWTVKGRRNSSRSGVGAIGARGNRLIELDILHLQQQDLTSIYEVSQCERQIACNMKSHMPHSVNELGPANVWIRLRALSFPAR
jgi:hypothetical protein